MEMNGENEVLKRDANRVAVLGLHIRTTEWQDFTIRSDKDTNSFTVTYFVLITDKGC